VLLLAGCDEGHGSPAIAACAEEVQGEWKSLPQAVHARQEASYIESGGLFYLGSGKRRAHEVFNPASQTWDRAQRFELVLDHIQAVELDGLVYYIGGLSDFPGPHSSAVYVYDPQADDFRRARDMPRGRGAGGIAVYEGKIYVAGGLSDGRPVDWFDIYDPATDSWRSLPDMPVVRDHFQAAIVDGVFYAIGGRQLEVGAAVTEDYSFALGEADGDWQELPQSLPTPRGGFAVAVLDGSEILVIGGEGPGDDGLASFSTVESYNVMDGTWCSLPPLPTTRHGIQAVVCAGAVYVAAGATEVGGTTPSTLHDVYFRGRLLPCSE
jgi:N-acetylneuraminic acid mutarotase